jgi:hypothetical protein
MQNSTFFNPGTRREITGEKKRKSEKTNVVYPQQQWYISPM